MLEKRRGFPRLLVLAVSGLIGITFIFLDLTVIAIRAYLTGVGSLGLGEGFLLIGLGAILILVTALTALKDDGAESLRTRWVRSGAAFVVAFGLGSIILAGGDFHLPFPLLFAATLCLASLRPGFPNLGSFSQAARTISLIVVVALAVAAGAMCIGLVFAAPLRRSVVSVPIRDTLSEVESLRHTSTENLSALAGLLSKFMPGALLIVFLLLALVTVLYSCRLLEVRFAWKQLLGRAGGMALYILASLIGLVVMGAGVAHQSLPTIAALLRHYPQQERVDAATLDSEYDILLDYLARPTFIVTRVEYLAWSPDTNLGEGDHGGLRIWAKAEGQPDRCFYLDVGPPAKGQMALSVRRVYEEPQKVALHGLEPIVAVDISSLFSCPELIAWYGIGGGQLEVRSAPDIEQAALREAWWWTPSGENRGASARAIINASMRSPAGILSLSIPPMAVTTPVRMFLRAADLANRRSQILAGNVAPRLTWGDQEAFRLARL